MGNIKEEMHQIRFTVYKIFLCSEMEIKNAVVPKQVDAKKAFQAILAVPGYRGLGYIVGYQHRTEQLINSFKKLIFEHLLFFHALQALSRGKQHPHGSYSLLGKNILKHWLLRDYKQKDLLSCGL